jgi:hypothetical protein
MKVLLTLALVPASLLLTGCDTLVVEHQHASHGYYSGGYYDGGYYGHRPYARESVVVVNGPGYRRPAPYYGGGARIVYSTDKHGKYHWHNGRKVYVSRW